MKFSTARSALIFITIACMSAGIAWAQQQVKEAVTERYTLTLESLDAPPQTRWQAFRALLKNLQLRTIGIIRPAPGTKFTVTAVAYSSTVGQTDLTPCITAAGTRVRQGIIATNFLPLGTRIRIDDEIYIVEDRMNARYNGKYIIDVWHPTKKQALQFGRQKLTLEIIEYGPVGPPTPTPDSTLRASKDDRLASQVENEVIVRLRSLSQALSRFTLLRVIIPQEEDCLATE
jgi:3D (Asp-Asp-Asp) domain-containing protein